MDFICGFLESLILIPFCLLWFRQVFRQPIYKRLVDQPCYWFVTGILFYPDVQLPALLFTAQEITHGQGDKANDLFSANNYGLAISYILFEIGMTWRSALKFRRQQQAGKTIAAPTMSK